MKMWGTALVLALAIGAGAAVRADVQDFSVLNKTGLVITGLYVSEVDDNAWGEDILGRGVLLPDEEVTINFHGFDDDECDFDVRIDDKQGTQWVVKDIDLCQIHKLTFRKKGKDIIWEAR